MRREVFPDFIQWSLGHTPMKGREGGSEEEREERWKGRKEGERREEGRKEGEEREGLGLMDTS